MQHRLYSFGPPGRASSAAQARSRQATGANLMTQTAQSWLYAASSFKVLGFSRSQSSAAWQALRFAAAAMCSSVIFILFSLSRQLGPGLAGPSGGGKLDDVAQAVLARPAGEGQQRGPGPLSPGIGGPLDDAAKAVLARSAGESQQRGPGPLGVGRGGILDDPGRPVLIVRGEFL